MRYHYEKPSVYLSMYGEIYICEHPVYDRCTLFRIGDKGLAVIQQRFDISSNQKNCPECNIQGNAYSIDK